MNAISPPDDVGSPKPAGHPAVLSGRVGVLIANLGTPEGTDYWSMRRYLKEFLSDPRVIEAPRPIWLPILQLILLRRPTVRGRDYAAIWNVERDEGPLKTITRSQSEKLGEALSALTPQIEVDWAMRYGKPPIADSLKSLRAKGCDRILVIPLYPQYCAASTATVCDKVFDTLKAMRWQPALRIAAPYYDDPVYIEALARLGAGRPRRPRFRARGRARLLSRHSPSPISTRAIPTTAIAPRRRGFLREALGSSEERLRMTFQSRFGRAEWLKPYTAASGDGAGRGAA